MEFDHFLTTAKAVELPPTYSYYHGWYFGSRPRTEDPWAAQTSDNHTYLVHECETGGVEGGSCWDDSDPQPYVTGESLGRFVALQEVLRTVAPTISFLEYEEILGMVQTSSHVQYEYYENETAYSYQFINLKDLWCFLSERGHLA